MKYILDNCESIFKNQHQEGFISFICVQEKFVYGQRLFYPLCKYSKLFTKLTNRKTLTINDLGIIRQMDIYVSTDRTSAQYLSKLYKKEKSNA